jgi:hypothetical protein
MKNEDRQSTSSSTYIKIYIIQFSLWSTTTKERSFTMNQGITEFIADKNLSSKYTQLTQLKDPLLSEKKKKKKT